MLATDMMYFAVVRDGHDGGVQITASHNPEAVQRHQDGAAGGLAAVSGDAGIGEIRDMMVGEHLPPAAARLGTLTQAERRSTTTWSTSSSSSTRRSSSRSTSCSMRQRHGRPRRAEALRPAALQDDAAVLRHRRHVPQPRSQSAHRGEPPRHHRSACSRRRPTSASPGTATRIAASSSTATASSSPATSSRHCSPRRSSSSSRARRSSTTCARAMPSRTPSARYGGHGAHEPGGPRVLQGAHARGQCRLRRRSHRPLLLPGLLLRRQRVHPGAAHPRADVRKKARRSPSCSRRCARSTSSRARSTRKLAGMAQVQAKLDGLAQKYADGHVYMMDGVSVEYPDWHFNVRASNTEPLSASISRRRRRR